MKTRMVVSVLALSIVIALVSTVIATQWDPAWPLAELWDHTAELPDNYRNEAQTWSIVDDDDDVDGFVWRGSDDVFDDGARYPFCVGIVKYKSYAEKSPDPTVHPTQPNGTIEEVDIYGFYAMPLPDGWEKEYCADLGEIEMTLLPSSVLLLHAYKMVGSIKMAKSFSYYASTQENPVFVLSINAPGQCTTCTSLSDELFRKDECTLPYPIVSPFANRAKYCSGGEGMDHYELTDGFGPNFATPEPDYAMFWSYGLAGMRGIGFLKALQNYGGPNYEYYPITNGNVIIGGVCGGGITSLLINVVDDRHLGVFALITSGGIMEDMEHYGSWFGTLADNDKESWWPGIRLVCPDDLASLTCDENRPANLTENECALCRMLGFFDPFSVYDETEPLAGADKGPILLTAGAQDEYYQADVLAMTYDKLVEYQGDEKIFAHWESDLDHGLFTSFLTLAGTWETFFNFRFSDLFSYEPVTGNLGFTKLGAGINRMYSSTGLFIQSIISAAGVNYPAAPVYPPGTSPSAGQPYPEITLVRYPIGIGMDGNLHFWSEYTVRACFGEDPPEGVEADINFGVSLDRYFHVLPACAHEDATLDPINGRYTINLTNDHFYDFNAACSGYDPDKGYYVNNRCSARNTLFPLLHVDNGNIFTGVNDASGLDNCRQFTVAVGTDKAVWEQGAKSIYPYNFSAWAETQYLLEVDGFQRYLSSSSLFNSYSETEVGTGRSGRKDRTYWYPNYCIRPAYYSDYYNEPESAEEFINFLEINPSCPYYFDEEFIDCDQSVVLDNLDGYLENGVVDLTGYNVTLSNSFLEVLGDRLIMYTNCNLEIQEEASLTVKKYDASDRQAGLYIYARDMQIDGDLSVYNDKYEATLFLGVDNDLLIGNTSYLRTKGIEDSHLTGGVVAVGGGSLTMNGTINTSAGEYGGVVNFYFGGDMEIDGELQTGAKASFNGGSIDLLSNHILSITESAYLDVSTIGKITLTSCETEIDKEAYLSVEPVEYISDKCDEVAAQTNEKLLFDEDPPHLQIDYCEGYEGLDPCCTPEDPCGWKNDGACDCQEKCAWDINDEESDGNIVYSDCHLLYGFRQLAMPTQPETCVGAMNYLYENCHTVFYGQQDEVLSADEAASLCEANQTPYSCAPGCFAEHQGDCLANIQCLTSNQCLGVADDDDDNDDNDNDNDDNDDNDNDDNNDDNDNDNNNNDDNDDNECGCGGCEELGCDSTAKQAPGRATFLQALETLFDSNPGLRSLLQALLIEPDWDGVLPASVHSVIFNDDGFSASSAVGENSTVCRVLTDHLFNHRDGRLSMDPALCALILDNLRAMPVTETEKILGDKQTAEKQQDDLAACRALLRMNEDEAVLSPILEHLLRSVEKQAEKETGRRIPLRKYLIDATRLGCRDYLAWQQSQQE